MYKWLVDNIYIFGVAIILVITSYFFYVEDVDSPAIMIAILIMVILSIVVLSNKKIAIYSIIALSPISLPIYISFLSLEISFPTEFITLILIITLGSVLFINEKFNKNIILHPISILLIIDLCCTLFATSFSVMHLVSFKRLLLKAAYISIFYFLFSHWYSNSTKKYSLYFLYAIGLIYPIYNTFKWHSFQDFSVASSFAMCQPFYSDHTIYGACLAFILPFLGAWLYYRKNESRVLYLSVFLLTLVIVTAEILSYSRASWISLMAVALFGLLLRFKIKISHIITTISLLFLVVFFNYETIYTSLKQQDSKVHTEENISDHLGSVTNLQTDASNLERINRWTCAVRMFNEKPFTGFGPGTYQFEYGKFQSVDIMTRISTHDGKKGNAHSEYLTYLSEYGIFGFITFLILVFYSLHIGLKSYYYFKDDINKKVIIFGALSGLITFYVHGVFNTFIDSEKMAVLVYGSLSILVIYDLKRRELSVKE